jgi:phage gp36-like protein
MGDFIDSAYMQGYYQVRDLISLTNNDSSAAAAIDATVMDDTILKAESYVKTYVQTKYSLPFTTIPEIVKVISAQTTYYYLQQRKYRITPELQALWENNMKSLQDIATGVSTLDTLPGVNAFQDANTQFREQSVWEEVPFTDAKMEGWC